MRTNKLKAVSHLTILTLLSLFSFQHARAQTSDKRDKPIVRPILSHLRPGVMIYLGAGSNSPSNKAKDDAYATNTVGFDANVFVSVIKKKNFSFGFNGGGEYFSSNKDNLPASPNVFHVPGETSGTVAVTSSGNPKNSGFKLGVAPQVNFFIGKHIIISPMIEAGYMSMTSKGFSAVQTTNIDGTLYNFTLLSKTETKTSGLAITPKVRLNYMFTKNIGMWIEGNYTVGPTIKSRINTFLPEPEPDENGQYNIEQMTNGTTKTEMRETKFGSFGVHVGVVFSIYDYPHPEDDLLKKAKINEQQVRGPIVHTGTSDDPPSNANKKTIPINCIIAGPSCTSGGGLCNCILGIATTVRDPTHDVPPRGIIVKDPLSQSPPRVRSMKVNIRGKNMYVHFVDPLPGDASIFVFDAPTPLDASIAKELGYKSITIQPGSYKVKKEGKGKIVKLMVLSIYDLPHPEDEPSF